MKTLIVVIFLLVGMDAWADMIIQPEEIVTNSIAAARNDRLTRYLDSVDIASIAVHPRHAMPQSRFLSLLKSIDPAQIKYGGLDRRVGGTNATALVRMIAPVRMDFIVEMRSRDDGVKDNHWVIVGIQPTE